MINKRAILIAALFMSTALSAFDMSSLMQTGQSGQKSKDEQRDIKTKSDYLEFEKLLKSYVEKNDYSKAFILGALYEKEFKLQDGEIIKANPKKAMAMYEYSAQNGYSPAFYKLGLIEIANKNVDAALRDFENAAKGKSRDFAPISAVAYASTVLDYKESNVKALLQASEILFPYAKRVDLPTAAFVMSQLELRLNRNEDANKYLSLACNNRLAPKEINDICYGDSVEVQKDGQKLKNVKCPTCNQK